MSIRLTDPLKNILHILGVLITVVSGIILMPLLVLPFYPKESNQAIYFIVPACLAFLIGLGLRKFRPQKPCKLDFRQDTVVVFSLWILSTLLSSLPFILSGMLNFTQAYFEAMSGWTTAGLSVIDVEQTSHMFLMFRSIMQFFGSVGVVLIVVSALSETYGMSLYNAEGHSDKLLPNLAKSARMILTIYIGYFVSGTILYIVFGMPVFDAINHCMAALSTGGFSVKADSIGAYNSVSIEITTIVLMLLGATNFFASMLLINRRFKAFFKLGEMRFLFLILGLAIPLVAVISFTNLYGGLAKSLRISMFELISALTTTGFSTVGYGDWPAFSLLILLAFMLIGGCAGSTAGGIKLSRIYLLSKIFWWKIKRRFMPEHSVNDMTLYYPQGKVHIDRNHYEESANYFFIYLVIIFMGTAILSIGGYSLQDSLFEFISATGTVGLSIGITAPDAPAFVLWTLTGGMLLGRLEVFVIFVAIIKIFKDIKGIKNK